MVGFQTSTKMKHCGQKSSGPPLAQLRVVSLFNDPPLIQREFTSNSAFLFLERFEVTISFNDTAVSAGSVQRYELIYFHVDCAACFLVHFVLDT